MEAPGRLGGQASIAFSRAADKTVLLRGPVAPQPDVRSRSDRTTGRPARELQALLRPRTLAMPPKRTPKKRPFDIDVALDRVRKAVEPYPKAALFELAADGHGSVFEILVACVLSIRTYDEVSLPTARAL